MGPGTVFGYGHALDNLEGLDDSCDLEDAHNLERSTKAGMNWGRRFAGRESATSLTVTREGLKGNLV